MPPRCAAFHCHIDTTLGGGCKVVHFGAHMGLCVHPHILTPYHSPLPYLHVTYPSHFHTRMPHAAITCRMQCTSVTCYVCVLGHKMIFTAGQSRPATPATQSDWSTSVVWHIKNDLVVYCSCVKVQAAHAMAHNTIATTLATATRPTLPT